DAGLPDAGVRDAGLPDAGLPDGGRTLPAGIAELVASRLQTLGAEVDEMLQVAAVLGRSFDVTLAQRASSLDLEAAHGALDRAVAAHLVEPVRGQPGRMTFVHALVQEAMVSRPAPSRLATLHARAVGALDDDVRAGSEVALAAAARHALAAVPSISVEHMAELVERAGSALTAAHAPADAVELLSRAQSVCEEAGAPVRVLVAVRLALGEALRASDRHEQASGVFEVALSQALRLGDGPGVARATLGLLGPVVSVGRVDREAVAILEAALDALGTEAPALRARVEARLAIELAYDRDDRRRDGLTERALTAARALGDPRARAEALGARHVALWGPDHTMQRLPIADEMLALARRLDDPALELQARTWLIVDLEEVGDGAAVDAEIEAYAATAARSGLSAYAWYVPAWRAARAYLGGRPRAARELQRRAARLGQEAGDPNAEFAARLQIILMLADDTPAEVDVDWLESKVRASPAAWAYRCMFAWVLAACGREREARRQLGAQGPAEWPRDTNWLSAAKERASAAVLLDDRRAGAEMEHLLSPFADRLVVSARAFMCMGSVAGTLGGLAGLRGDRDAAIALYEQAIEREERAGARIWAMHHRLRLGEALAAAGASDQATVHRDVVAGEAGAMGLARLAERAGASSRCVGHHRGAEAAR
ncbi:MAG TPA: hypothetical protein VE571_12590, partial [Solirubrobacteraceae bacterium]|nr:hypothetical protein [Solirubrobacteraceae bacterium]